MAEAALVVGIIAGLFVILFGSRGLLDLGKGIVERRRAKANAGSGAAAGGHRKPSEGVVLPAAGTPSLNPAPPAIYRRVFVGRQAELTVLQAAFDNAATGHGSAVLIEGPPGIGKSALCAQLVAYVSPRKGEVLRVTSDAPFQVEAFVRGKPSLVIADEPDVPLVKTMLAQADDLLTGPTLLVFAAAPDGGPDATAPLRKLARFQHVHLRGLSLDDVCRYLRELMGTEMPDALAHAVQKETEGNPLFVTELVRYLAEKGNLSLRGDRWEWDGHLPEEVVASDAPIAIVRQRLASLNGETLKVLKEAAAAGETFDARGLRKGHGNRVQEALEEAVVRHIIERAQGRYAFTHGLVRGALLDA